jgi:hypothetical protein
MNTGEKLHLLMHWCKASVSILINQHRDSYQTVSQYLDMINDGTLRRKIDPEILQNMRMLDQIVEIHFYPHTPIGSHKVWHYDLDLALDDCVEIIRNEDARLSFLSRNK